MNRLHRILLIVLAVQVALAVVVFLPKNDAGAAGQPLLGLKVDDITGLTITDDQGATTRLVKDNGTWVLPDAGSFPADAAKVTPVLTKLAAVTTGKRVAQTAASQPQLQVADNKFSRKVELATAAGTKTLYVGTSAGGQASHVRLAGQDDVYIGTGLASWELSGAVTSWIDTSYVSIAAADVTGLKLQNAAGQWTFQKDAQGTWTQTSPAAAGPLDANAVSALAGQFSALAMTKPLGKVANDPQYGLTQPTAQITLDYKSGDQAKSLTINVGAKDEADGSYAVKSSDSEYVVRVAEYAVKDAVERTSFAQATPTPAAAPVGTPTPAQ